MAVFAVTVYSVFTKQAEEEVGIRPVVLLVMYWTQIEVSHQLVVAVMRSFS